VTCVRQSQLLTLKLRTESVNFIHDVNVLRQTLKSVYSGSADLQALNSEIDKLPKNCRVQVLPVCWRHLLDFPRKGVRQNRKEHDIGEPFVRSLITDLGEHQELIVQYAPY
jgi:hypothetical protein